MKRRDLTAGILLVVLTCMMGTASSDQQKNITITRGDRETPDLIDSLLNSTCSIENDTIAVTGKNEELTCMGNTGPFGKCLKLP